MSDEARARRGYGFWVVAGVLVALVIYFLSLGPAVYFVQRTGTGRETAGVVYTPLIWLGQNTPLSGPFDWYVRKWQSLATPSPP
jgi:hypothetical protein